MNHGHAVCGVNTRAGEQHKDRVKVEEHESLNLEAERAECPEGRRRKISTEKVESIPLPLPKHRSGDPVLEYFQGQRLTGLESKWPGDLHWLPYQATSGSTGPFTQQVVLKWIWPQVLFDNLSNPVRFWKAMV